MSLNTLYNISVTLPGLGGGGDAISTVTVVSLGDCVVVLTADVIIDCVVEPVTFTVEDKFYRIKLIILSEM